MTSPDSDFRGVFDDEASYASETRPIREVADRIASTTHTSSRTVLWILGFVAALVLVLMGIVFYTMIAAGQRAATSVAAKESASAAASEIQKEAEEDNEAESSEDPSEEAGDNTIEQAREKVANLMNTTTCKPDADADAILALARLAEQEGTWDADKAVVDKRLSELPRKCGGSYPDNFASRLRADSTPDGLKALVETTLAYIGADKSPAPEDAIDVAAFSNPTRNIRCEADDEALSCTIYTYAFKSDECQGQPATYTLNADGTNSQSCTPQSSSGTTVSYGTTVARSGFACTVNKEGVECWHEKTGNGFRLDRNAIEMF